MTPQLGPSAAMLGLMTGRDSTVKVESTFRGGLIIEGETIESFINSYLLQPEKKIINIKK